MLCSGLLWTQDAKYKPISHFICGSCGKYIVYSYNGSFIKQLNTTTSSMRNVDQDFLLSVRKILTFYNNEQKLQWIKSQKWFYIFFLKLRLRPFETQHPEIWVKILRKINADRLDTLFSNKIIIYIFRWLCRNPDLVSLRCCQVKNNFTPNLLHIFFNCMIISWASWACPSIFFLPRIECYVL